MESELAISFQRPWNVAVEPVKCSPAKSGFARAAAVISAPEPGRKLMTPSGRPASIISCLST